MNTQTATSARRIIIVIVILFVAGWSLLVTDTRSVNGDRQSEIPNEAIATASGVRSKDETARVVFVFDGDTIEIDDGRRVRYIGINAPESVVPEKPAECYGKESALENTKMLEGKTIRMETDSSDTDMYGRLLRYVYVDGVMINDYLIRRGYAKTAAYPPDIRYSVQFEEAQTEARTNNRGLWSACPKP